MRRQDHDGQGLKKKQKKQDVAIATSCFYYIINDMSILVS